MNRRTRDMQTFERDGKRVGIEFDADTGTWNVYSVKSRKIWALGFIFQPETYDTETGRTVTFETWSSARHTYTGIPADHGEGFASQEDAAFSLWNAVPYHGDKYKYKPSE
jgi:hypothetical protein